MMEINLGADTAGLYGMEAATRECESSKGSGESDCDFEEKRGKKEGKLGAKKKEKEDKDKDKKKDKDKRAYATLDGESSQEESEMEVKSPFKGKKRSFKFSSKKDKKEKEKKTPKECESPKEVRDESITKSEKKEKEKKEKKEKETKIKEKEKEAKVKDKESKTKEKEKETKSKDIKNKLKIKDKKKLKPVPSLEDDLPIFGAPLEWAVQRGRCHDGVDLPVVVRCCIDYIEEHGLHQEGIYRSSGLKTRVVELRRAYNNRENVALKDVDAPIVASLLKQYLRELPENILTNELLPKFEDASTIKDLHQQEEALRSLVQQLPRCNAILLSWLMVHMGHVIEKERFTKMNVQNISIVLCPTLNLTHRVLGCLFTHNRALFGQIQLTRYVPPLSGAGVSLPEDHDAMSVELKKQESLLAQIHEEMRVGSVAKHREEHLWEAQRIVTQLKRQLKHQAPFPPTSLSTATSTLTTASAQSTEKSPDVSDGASSNRERSHDEDELRLELALPTEITSEECDNVDQTKSTLPTTTSDRNEPHPTRVDVNAAMTSEMSAPLSTDAPQHVTVIEISNRTQEIVDHKRQTASIVFDSEMELELLLLIENQEREKIIEQLKGDIEKERKMVERLHEQLAETQLRSWSDSSEEDENVERDTEEKQEQQLAEVLRENRQLEEQNVLLLSQIEEAREACLRYRVQLRLREEKAKLLFSKCGNGM